MVIVKWHQQTSPKAKIKEGTREFLTIKDALAFFDRLSELDGTNLGKTRVERTATEIYINGPIAYYAAIEKY